MKAKSLRRIGEVEEFTAGMQFEDFVEDNKCRCKVPGSYRRGSKENA